VRVDPMKPKSKPPGTKRLKLGYGGLLSNFGFIFNLRRYTEAERFTLRARTEELESAFALMKSEMAGLVPGL
jgi:hypothetical protein